jgi:ABC-type branched-subunit amino acid transport system substrate-binding protein
VVAGRSVKRRDVVAGLGLLVVAPPAFADHGIRGREIVVGGAVTLSGPLGPTGEQLTKYGVDVAVAAVNEAGGVHGRPVRTIWRDDEARPERARAETARLVADEHVLAVLTPLGAGPAAAVAGEAVERKVPVLLPADGSPALRGLRWVFPGTMLYDRQARLTIDYLVTTRKLARIALLYHDDAYGRGVRELVERELARHRLRPVAAVTIAWAPTDVAAVIRRVRAARPDVTLLITTPRPAAEVLKARQEQGWSGLVVAMGPLADERFLGIAGPASDGVEALAPWPDPRRSELPGVVRYREALLRRFPTSEPTRPSLAGYFAGLLLAEAARRAGPPLSRDALVDALERLSGWDSGILPPLTIGPDHETQKSAQWTRMERGRLTPVTDWLGRD